LGLKTLFFRTTESHSKMYFSQFRCPEYADRSDTELQNTITALTDHTSNIRQPLFVNFPSTHNITYILPVIILSNLMLSHQWQ